MNTIALALALGGVAAVFTAWLTYLSTIPRGVVPARPVGAIGMQLAGIALAIASVIWSLRAGGSLSAVVIAPASFALIMGSLFLLLMSQRKTPIGDIKVAVGDALPAFSCQTSAGVAFSSDALLGQRTLLKFFRGGW